MVIKKPKRTKTQRTQNIRPRQMVKSTLVWKAKMVRAMTMTAVAAAAMRTRSQS